MCGVTLLKERWRRTGRIPDTWNRSSICCKCLSRRLSKVDLASIGKDKGLTSSRQKEGKSLLSHMYHTFQRLPPSLNSSDWAPTVHLGYQTDKLVTETSRQRKERLTIRISRRDHRWSRRDMRRHHQGIAGPRWTLNKLRLRKKKWNTQHWGFM